MKNYLYDVFISFPLTEKDEELKKAINTHDFFIAQKINHVLNNLLHVKTFFSDESLLNNDDNDFWKKIKNVLPQSKALVIILSSKEDYYRYYCTEERRLYLKRNKKERKIYFLVSSQVIKDITEFDIMDLDVGKPEVILWDEISQQQRFYNFINNYFLKNEKGNNKEVLICKNCEKIFYKGNYEGTVCLHHNKKDIKISEDGLTIKFNCCNKIVRLKNKNALIDLAPGCIEKVSHTFE